MTEQRWSGETGHQIKQSTKKAEVINWWCYVMTPPVILLNIHYSLKNLTSAANSKLSSSYSKVTKVLTHPQEFISYQHCPLLLGY